MRTETVERTLFEFDELSDAAKERARECWRERGPRYEWYEFVYDDVVHVAALLGIEIKEDAGFADFGGRPLHILFSGFWSQGDGACFEGRYAYRSGGARAVRAYAPADIEIHAIADGLQKLQKRFFYQLEAVCTHSGCYYHANCMDVRAGRVCDVWKDVDADTEKALTDLLRDFANWIYRQLEAEYDYQTSDEYVDETLSANCYEFDIDGNPA